MHSPRARAADDPLAILIVPDDWRGPLVRDPRMAGDPWSYRDVDMRLIDPFPHAREDLNDPWSGWPRVRYGQCSADCSVVIIPTGWDD